MTGRMQAPLLRIIRGAREACEQFLSTVEAILSACAFPLERPALPEPVAVQNSRRPHGNTSDLRRS
jgi:hypothetical protein